MSGLMSLFLVCVVILGGIFFYVFRMDSRLKKLENSEN
jgi:CcmD family protein